MMRLFLVSGFWIGRCKSFFLYVYVFTRAHPYDNDTLLFFLQRGTCG